MLESLKCEVIDLLAKCLPLLCEAVFVLVVHCLCERLFWLREELCTPDCICPKSSVEVPCVGVLCGQVSGLEILLCEGGDVELCARTSKHIHVFAIDPLTLTLSLFYIVPCFNSYCHIIYYMLDLFVCASLVFNHESFI